MKNYLSLFLILAISISYSQEKKGNEKAKDTIKTEVVNVVTSYVPKITDAFKIKQKPVIKHTKNTEKKALQYQIFSVPVASTFIPKSGVMKKVDLGKKERLYDNYFSVGLGNKFTPFLEAYVRQSENYNSELGAGLKFLLSSNPVENKALNSTFYNIDVNLFYTQHERYFSWTAGVDAARNKYNWYGLPTKITFTDATISNIEEAQNYNDFKVFGKINPTDSFIKEGNLSINYFSDSHESNEFLIDGNVEFQFPLNNFNRQLNDLHLNTTASYVGSNFATDYQTKTPIKASFFTFGVHPNYKFNVQDLAIQIGAKTYFSLDIENSQNNFFVYPDVEVSYPLIKEVANLFVGATGDITTNSYQSLTQNNPYVSPTQNILQTNTKFDTFTGIRGKLNHQFSYNFKASYATIENNPFYALNPSKSDGTTIAGTDGFTFSGYEYGNSFSVEYDDVKRLSFFGEIAFDGIKNLTIGANGQFNKFTLTNSTELWNTPKIKGEIFGTYKTHKWFAGANFYFVGQRKGKNYDVLPDQTFTTINLDGYFDINFNSGYHFNDAFSAFLNLNNVLNNNYQQFTNFNVQGFQAMAGLTWKFDSLF